MSLNGYSVADKVLRYGVLGGAFTTDEFDAHATWELEHAAQMGVKVRAPVVDTKTTAATIGVTVARPPFEDLWIEMTLPNGGDQGFAVREERDEDGSGTVHLFSAFSEIQMSTGPAQFIMHGTYDYGTDGVITGFSFGGGSLASMRFACEQADMTPGAVFEDQFAHVIMAIALMNCKNVSLVDAPVKAKPRSKKQRRKRTPALTFKTIKLPGGSSSGGEGTGEPGETARHIVRGNFATYTEENPLFGNITGTFWRPAHVRGKTKHGIVQKDYEVMT